MVGYFTTHLNKMKRFFYEVSYGSMGIQLENENDAERDRSKTLHLSSSKDFEVSFESADINEDTLYLLGVLHWYDWWNGDRIEYDFEVIK